MATAKPRALKLWAFYFVGGCLIGTGGSLLLVGEFIGLFNDAVGDTISEHVWGLPRAAMLALVALSAVLAVLFLWLAGHFYYRWEGTRTLGPTFVEESDSRREFLREELRRIRESKND